jgi:hypothetical protein
LLKYDSKILNIAESNNKQIIKDLNRTYPNTKIFQESTCQVKMLNVLKAYSNYDHEISKNK